MFCDNVSYDTERLKNNCSQYCSPKEGHHLPPSYNFFPTQQSLRNPSNLFNQKNTPRQSQHPYNKKSPHINQAEAFQLINQNTKRQTKKIQAASRNNKICAILSTVLAFSQRIEVLKQKLCGYPAQNFSPVQFFNVLDITQKGNVDIYDIKRFVNNQKIREKDIIALFKRVNGDHAKDNTRLTYFGYLNLIKPYFNEQLARDLLLRDTNAAKRTNKSKQNSPVTRIDNQMIEPTQESVLLLFQELILLQCICTTQHEQAKQTLMNEYMLNTIQIKQIIGLEQSDHFQHNSSLGHLSNTQAKTRHKSPLSILFQFIQNNSQFEIQFQDMKFLLAFLNMHEFSLTNEKCLNVLFLPTNCKAEILQQIKKNKEENLDVEGAQNYMNTYLTKENLMNKGNIHIIREYLDQKDKLHLTQQHMRRTSAPYKANFLQFVHPRSFNRMDQNNLIPSAYELPNQYQPQHIESPYPSSQHPHIQINASNKQLSRNQRVSFMQAQMDPSQRQYSNNSSVPQQNIKVNAPRQTLIKQDYGYHAGLNNQFYEAGPKDQIDDGNASDLSNTPFLQKFMKNDNNNRWDQKYPQKGNYKKMNGNQQNSKITSSAISDSAFQVVDYGYEPHHADEKSYLGNRKPSVKKIEQSQRFKKQSLDSRYNLVVSQYKNSNLYGQDAKKMTKNKQGESKLLQVNEQSYSIGGKGSMGPKFQKSRKGNNLGIGNQILDYSRGNYINSVGLSQSNVVNESNFMNRFYQNGGNILNDFLKK